MVDTDVERQWLRPLEQRPGIHGPGQCPGRGYPDFPFRQYCDDYSNLYMDRRPDGHLVLLVGERQYGRQDTDMVYGGTSRLWFWNRYLLGHSVRWARPRCGTVVDTDLERKRRLWALEQRYVVLRRPGHKVTLVRTD